MTDKIHLTKQQAKQLLKHKGVQLKPTQIGCGIPIPADFPARHKKALQKAHKSQKGMRLVFTPEEVIQGGSVWDWLYNNIAKPFVNVVRSTYKPLAEVARPLVRQFAPEIATAASSLTGLPITKEHVLGAEDLSKKVLGVGAGRVPKTRTKKLPTRVVRREPPTMVSRGMLTDTSATMMTPQHPVFGFQPQFKGHDLRRVIGETTQMGGAIQIDPRQLQNIYCPPKGLGFKPAGYGFRAAGY